MRPARRWFVVGLLVLVGLAGAGCNRQSSKTAGRLTVNGRAEVAVTSGEKVTVTRARTLKSGEQVRMVDGAAMLSLGGGRELELRKDSVVRLSVRAGATGQSESRGELVSGDVLVLASGDAATVVAGDSTVQVTGAAKVSKDLAVVAAVYQGAAGVESAGRSVSVPALRQVTVPAPGLPSRPTPLSFSASDSWDQRYLGDAIDLGNQLAARSKGFSAQLPSGTASVAFFRAILPGLGTQPFDESLLVPSRPPGETLVGSAITLEGTKGAFTERWASVFGFHDDGAPWGLVAADQGVSRTSLLAAIDAAIARVPGIGGAPSGEVAAPAPAPPPGATTPTTLPPPSPTPSTPFTPSTPAPATPTPTTPTPTTPVSPTSPTSPLTGTPTQTPTTTTTGPLNTGIPLLDDTVRAVVDALTGLLGELGLS